MILLTGADILAAVSCSDAVGAVEESFILYEQNQFTMPKRMHIEHGDNTLLLMPCFGTDAFATKLVSVFPQNAQKDMPVLNGIVVLNSMETGEPLALLNGRTLTALRTGAVGAAGVKHLSPDNAGKLGVIGTGVQAYYQVLCAAAVRSLTHLSVLATSFAKGEAFAEKIGKELPGISITVAGSAEELLSSAEVVITATTSKVPVLPEDEALLRGKTFVGVGSFQPHVREFPEALYRLVDKVYVDAEHAAYETGDVVCPLKLGWIGRDQVETLGSYLLNEPDKESVRGKTTLYKSVGMAAFDLMVARLIYKKAKALGLGQTIQL